MRAGSDPDPRIGRWGLGRVHGEHLVVHPGLIAGQGLQEARDLLDFLDGEVLAQLVPLGCVRFLLLRLDARAMGFSIRATFEWPDSRGA